MKDHPVVIRFPMHWGEMDALGHANNTRYFVWFESARMALFERVGLVSVGQPTVGPILAQTQCDFRRPITYPAELLVGARVGRLGTTSFTMEYQVEVVGDEGLAAVGRGVVVLIDYTTGQKVPISEELRHRLAALGMPGGSQRPSDP